MTDVLKPVSFQTIATVALCCLMGCADVLPNSMDGSTDGELMYGVWRNAFDTSLVGVLKDVWGFSETDIFVVGGIEGQARIARYDGQSWHIMDTPSVPPLSAVFGFGPEDVFAVGEQGTLLHYDGIGWRELNSGSDRNLNDVWGRKSNELWIVGGDAEAGEPVLVHLDGGGFESVSVPVNDRNATGLFGIWGIGERVFAVGSNGLIIGLTDGQWQQIPTGPAATEDFLSLWGASERSIVAVGGRTAGRIAVFDGAAWRTQFVADVTSIHAVHMVSSDQAIIGGTDGFVGAFNPLENTLVREISGANATVRSTWIDGKGRSYAVGGSSSPPEVGLALLRTVQDTPPDIQEPDGMDNPTPVDDTPPDDTADGPAEPDDEPPADDMPPPADMDETVTLGVISNGEFSVLADGSPMPLIGVTDTQVEIRISFQVRGFESNAQVRLTGGATVANTADVVIPPFILELKLEAVNRTVNQLSDVSFVLDRETAAALADADVLFAFVITDQTDPNVSEVIMQTHVLASPR